MSVQASEYGEAVRRREVLLAGWLGLELGTTLSVRDDDPDEHGVVEVWWRSMAPELPRRGHVRETGAAGSWGEPTVHSGVLVLHPSDVAEMREAVGPKPELLTAEQRAALERLRAAEAPAWERA